MNKEAYKELLELGEKAHKLAKQHKHPMLFLVGNEEGNGVDGKKHGLTIEACKFIEEAVKDIRENIEYPRVLIRRKKP